MTVLIDTSAWVEFFRKTRSSANRAATQLFTDRERFATCGPVEMELKAGARDNDVMHEIAAALAQGRTFAIQPHYFESAAALYRQCRTQGVTIRSMIDCLIAVVAIDNDLEVLHHDHDFAAIASVVPLRVHPASLN
ncbi:MAG: type II toxin-antitoxin system VapC family toxin [Ilumatobacteraceae bacterium]